MPTPINRPSIDTDLEQRYQKQHVGGAYDAKTVNKVFADNMPNEFANGFTKGGKNTNLPKKDSMYLSGFSNRRYR